MTGISSISTVNQNYIIRQKAAKALNRSYYTPKEKESHKKLGVALGAMTAVVLATEILAKIRKP